MRTTLHAVPVLLSMLFSLAVGACSTPSAKCTSLSVELHHSRSDHVYLVFSADGEHGEVEMDRISEREYAVDLELEDNREFFVNFRVTADEYPDAELWVAKKWGIDAAAVEVNGFPITESYLVETGVGPSAAFSIVLDSSLVYSGAGDRRIIIEEPIPPEVSGHRGYVLLQLPPEGFSAALPWMQAMHTGGVSTTSSVEIDYMRFFAHTPEGDVLLGEDDFSIDCSLAGYDHGGTYLRHPFFFDEANSSWAMPAEITKGVLVILPHLRPDLVYHWWLSERAAVPADAEYLYMETRVRIKGEVCVQAGMDFWRNEDAPYAGLNVNNTEAGLSDFIFPSDEWQVLILSTEELIPWNE